MNRKKFIIIGSGWRSLFYWRIACVCPDRLEMTAMLCRSEEKAHFMRTRCGIPAVTSEEICEKSRPDYVVVAVNKASIASVAEYWLKKGYPVLCETPAAGNLNALRRLWSLSRSGARLQVAEQYHRMPLFAAAVCALKKGYLGEPYAMDISCAHDYHAISLMRRCLGTGLTQVRISAKQFMFPVEATDSRNGALFDGKIDSLPRLHAVFEFAGGKTAFYDFCGVQYHSFIRGKYFRIQGPRGELTAEKMLYTNEQHIPQEIPLAYEKCAAGKNAGKICAGTEVLYENSFFENDAQKAFNDDEAALASLLMDMNRYVETGAELYPLCEALEDAYLALLLHQAAASGKTVRSHRQPWVSLGYE
ncbi:MAG: Gfo/Idh/MocA family oxidoreductase [Bacteroides sp.]|nr:Gfo/Idh/MocA family oxidoreductase [Prevotella sp.]MCM1407478.1 Gfo/Idh/MocA family oxidoreductase [Treponema brennaborense]MCM1469968.1 Gfo/Idh/MocA family oxidoreductase [Bacteroides sp.]